jgi:hypothetical protein
LEISRPHPRAAQRCRAGHDRRCNGAGGGGL